MFTCKEEHCIFEMQMQIYKVQLSKPRTSIDIDPDMVQIVIYHKPNFDMIGKGSDVFHVRNEHPNVKEWSYVT